MTTYAIGTDALALAAAQEMLDLPPTYSLSPSVAREVLDLDDFNLGLLRGLLREPQEVQRFGSCSYLFIGGGVAAVVAEGIASEVVAFDLHYQS